MGGGGGLGFYAGGHRRLGRYSISAGIGSPDPTPPPAKSTGGGTPNSATAIHHDGAGRYSPQHPRGDGGGGGLRGLAGR